MTDPSPTQVEIDALALLAHLSEWLGPEYDSEAEQAIQSSHAMIEHLLAALRSLQGELAAMKKDRDGSRQGPLLWAVDRWNAEVKNRPLVNIHRRALDTTWRQVIRQFGGDPDDLLGPSHGVLVDENPHLFKEKPSDPQAEALSTDQPQGVRVVPPLRERVEVQLSEEEKFLKPSDEPFYPKMPEGRCKFCGVSFAALQEAPAPATDAIIRETKRERDEAHEEVAKLVGELAEEGFLRKEAEREFKNFHRNLCERFDYTHDEKDWQRDQVSLIEWIAKRCVVAESASAEPQPMTEVCPHCGDRSRSQCEEIPCPWEKGTAEPTAYRVVSEPSQSWHFARTRKDAEQIANNLLKYASRCTGARIEELYLSSPGPAPATEQRETKSRALAAEAKVERLAEALRTAHVAMSIASALPGVSDEYDFQPAKRAAARALADEKP